MSTSHTTTDHKEIQKWAEARKAKPSRVKGTGDDKAKGEHDDAGLIRLDFPGYSGKGDLEEITWDEWFEKFEEGKLALIYQEKTADGKESNFNKLVKRD